MGGQQAGWGARHPGGPSARSSISLGLETGEPKASAADLFLGPSADSGHQMQSLSKPCFTEGSSEAQ